MDKTIMKAEIESANIGEPLRVALLELIEKSDNQPASDTSESESEMKKSRRNK